MFRSFRFGTVYGIPLKIDISFLLVLPLFAWLIGVQIASLVDLTNLVLGTTIDPGPLTAGRRPWLLGLTAAVGLFFGVLLHELGHSVVAIYYGYDIDSITLWIFGGMAHLADQPDEWTHELAIAIAGPLVSVAVGVVTYLLLLPVPPSVHSVTFLFGYLALMNVGLAIFNMLPAFPMDGGRVLRALLSRNRRFAQATQLAAEVGKMFALLLGLFGLFQFNIILIGIAFFIYIAAAGEAQQTVMRATFEGVTVADIMTADVQTVTPQTTIAELLERMFGERHTGYPVVDRGDLVGLVTLEDAKGVDSVEREAFTVEDVMTTDLMTIPPRADAMSALTEMQRGGVGRLLVTDDGGDLVGIISRTDLMTAFDIIRKSGSIDPAREVGSMPGTGPPGANGEPDPHDSSDARARRDGEASDRNSAENEP